MASPLVVYVVVVMAAGTMSLPPNRDRNICYTTAKSQMTVPETKTRQRWNGWRYITENYVEYVRKPGFKTVSTCCDGYRTASNGYCEPVCDRGCEPPKVCAAPNSCRCPDHLVEDSSGQCVARLCLNRECQHGKCNPSNGVCVCDSGYRWQGERCEPVCQGGCGEGGTCSAPNSCVCSIGFRKAPKAIGCEPTSCPPGYELKRNGTHGLRTCRPLCTSGCPNGSCVASNTCQCGVGYEPAQTGDGDSTCVAVPRCWVNGYYAEPDTCRCLPGYQLTQSEEGLPTCQPDCGNTCGPLATCVGPDMCACIQGYRDERSFAEIETNAAIRCKPICAYGCGGGECIAPNQCQCRKSFRWWATYNCTNGTCSVLNKCKCWRDYETVPEEPSACRPHCDPPCGNGICVSPGLCMCSQGYELKKGICVPKCKNNCGYGTCIAPDQCECWPGHELATDGAGHEKCVPVCEPPCVHGECTAPDRCECWRGYQLNGSVCEPVCTQPCTNADCVEPDTCRCWDGFGPTPGDETNTVCQPTCNATCVNATCTAPNTCTCLEGFVRDSGDPSGATCRLPCPGHLCSEKPRGEYECLTATEDRDCACTEGRKLPLCATAATSPQGQVTWPVLMILPAALVAVALVVFLYVRNRQKKSATGDVPPQRLPSTSSKHSTSDEYDDASGYYRAKFPADTKKLIKSLEKRRVPNTKASYKKSSEHLDGLYEGIGGGSCSPVYGEIGDGSAEPCNSSELEPNRAGGGGSCLPSQMAENEFYGDPGDREWSRASTHAIENDLYTQQGVKTETNTFAEADLDEMYAKVTKKGSRSSSAKIVDNDFYGQPSRNRQENSSGKINKTGLPGGVLNQKTSTQQPEGHYEELSDGFGYPGEPREGRKERPAKRKEEQQYEEIGVARAKPSCEMVDNDLYRGSGSDVNSEFIRQEAGAEYEEIVNKAGSGKGEIVENSLYSQTGSGEVECSLGSEAVEGGLHGRNAVDQQKRRYLLAKIMERRGGNKKT